MRKNPHVRICGGLGSATTLVYPTGWRGVVSFLARLLVLEANVFHEVSASALGGKHTINRENPNHRTSAFTCGHIRPFQWPSGATPG